MRNWRQIIILIVATLFYHIHTAGQSLRADSITPEGLPQYFSWQQVWQETMNMEDNDLDDEEKETEMADYHELLQELAAHPIDLNTATREELEQLPFLSPQQVMDIIEYRDRYGGLKSVGEFRMINSIDYRQALLLPYFTYMGSQQEKQHFPHLSNIIKGGRHEISFYTRVPLYNRKGDHNGYLGYKYPHWTRYQFNYGNYVKIGLTGAQDAGEPFTWNHQQMGYDIWSYYVQVKELGILKNLVAGKYKVSAGMGLVMNTGFSLGKLAMLQNLGRQQSTLRAHTSGSTADYLEGIAATVALGHTTMTAFVSHRSIDATLNNDGSIATILQTGYHRTPNEQTKRNNSRLTSTGVRITYRHNQLRLGTTAVYDHLNRELHPNASALFRRYYAQGSNFANFGMDYSYLHHRLSFSGETAIDAHGTIATINSLSYQSENAWSIMALQRFYSYRYTSLHAHAFSEGGAVRNESGIYIGATWQPLARLHLQGYADFAHFPWARYRVSQPSNAQDYLCEATYLLSRQWTLKGRYRMHIRQLDNEQKTALRQHNEHHARLAATYGNKEWTTTIQGDGVKAANNTIEYGWMVSQNTAWKKSWWQLSAQTAYFDAPSYEARIYVYERQMPHVFASPAYYGRGFRLALTARAQIGQHLQLDAKIGHTHYYDRSTIGSGLQEIDGNSLTDIDLHVRWRI
jgi:hypothetical protein